MADFSSWSKENLVKFATESSDALLAYAKQIDNLQSDLKDCIKAYRELNTSLNKDE